jgi:hypothetical protein
MPKGPQGQKLPDADLPGWTFWADEISNSVYRVEGHHTDGGSVSRTGVGLDDPLQEAKRDASTLSERRYTQST